MRVRIINCLWTHFTAVPHGHKSFFTLEKDKFAMSDITKCSHRIINSMHTDALQNQRISTKITIQILQYRGSISRSFPFSTGNTQRI